MPRTPPSWRAVALAPLVTPHRIPGSAVTAALVSIGRAAATGTYKEELADARWVA